MFIKGLGHVTCSVRYTRDAASHTVPRPPAQQVNGSSNGGNNNIENQVGIRHMSRAVTS